MPPQEMPKLPEAAYFDLDSMLSRKFGKEVANYFAGMGFIFFFNILVCVNRL